MICGLRQLPRVQADRHRKRGEGVTEFIVLLETMDCSTCQEHKSDRDRAELRCGWMKSSEWVEPQFCQHTEDVCPGYAIGLPDVIEAARALHWRDKGALHALYGDQFPLPPAAIDAVDIMGAAISEVEAEAMRLAAKPKEPR